MTSQQDHPAPSTTPDTPGHARPAGPKPDNTYWVEEGYLLAGEYPGQPLEDAANRRRKLTRFLDAGVRAFLDLTHRGELDDYARLLADMAAQRGIEVQHCRMAIDDMGVPGDDRLMHRIQDQLRDWRQRGIPAYVHCWGGVGRTGTVIACHAIEQGMTPDQALQRLAKLWQQMSEDKRRRFPMSPQTPGQLRYVRNWQPARGGQQAPTA